MCVQRQHVMAAAHGHGRGGRKQSRGKLARRATWGTRPQEKGGPAGFLGSWGPHPWLFASARQLSYRPADWPQGGRRSAWARPSLFGAVQSQ